MIQNMPLRFSVLCILSLFIVSCSKKIPTLPEDINMLKAPVPSLSNLNLRLKLNRSELNNTLNYIINKQFSNGLEIDEDYKLLSKLNGPIDFQASKQTLIITLPLFIEVSPPGIFSKIKANGEVQLQLTTSIDIRDEKLLTKTELSHFHWTKKPVVKVLGMNIPIEQLANFIIKKYKQVLCSSIDDSLNKNLELTELRKSMKRYFNRPMYSSDDQYLHFFANPGDVALGPFTMTDTDLEIPFVVYFESIFTDSIPPDFNSEGSFSLRPFIENESSLHILSKIPLPYLEKIIKDSTENRTFGSGLTQVRVTQLQMHGSAKTVAIDLEMTGAYSGQVQLMFTPEFDADKKKIKLEDFRLKATKGAKIKKILFAVIRKIAEVQVKETLEDRINETLNDFLNQTRQSINGKSFAEGISVQGNLQDYNLNQFGIFDNKVYLNINLQLQLEARVDKINLSKLVLNEFY